MIIIRSNNNKFNNCVDIIAAQNEKMYRNVGNVYTIGGNAYTERKCHIIKIIFISSKLITGCLVTS